MRLCFVIAGLAGFPGLAFGVGAARDPFEVGSGCDVDRRRGAASASRRTSDWTDRSPPKVSTCPPPAARISRAVLLGTVAVPADDGDMRAHPGRPRAVALPMPAVPPVTSTVLPVIERAAGLLMTWSCPL